MGHEVWFTQVTPEELAQASIYLDRRWERQRDLADRPDEVEEPDEFDEWLEQLDEDGRPTADLYKYWAGIQFLLDAAGIPIDLYDNGFYLDSEGTCAWPREQVEWAAELLRVTPFDQLAPGFDPQRMVSKGVYHTIFWNRDGTLETLRELYEELVGFFDAAARSGSAAIKRSSF